MILVHFISSLAIKSCEISNDDETKNFVLIEDFCETENSAPIVQKNLEGSFIQNLEKNLSNLYSLISN